MGYRNGRYCGAAGRGQCVATGVYHRGEQFVGVLLDSATGQVVRSNHLFCQTDDSPVIVDDERFGARGALVDGQYGHSRALFSK